ncbi:uncharacterized protein LOC123246079 [Gracilinanus agilis]|uniref:uncharacterized protein LOC123246079 n=1 Tax=Gracilinanus agilis TaxID=191870 RepID=UPI001CFF20B9|nr:uncharacterized protein LOC123246079 [Gracilinanus agilis]
MDLAYEDSGLYEADIRSVFREINTQQFNLSVSGNIVSAVEISFLKGTLGQSILLCTATDYRNETHSINLIYKTQNQLMAKIQPRESEPGWTITTQDRYEERLSAPDMGCVKIENLTSEDSGLYEAEIMLITGKIKIQMFNVTVSELKEMNCPLKNILLWKGPLLRGILSWTPGTLDKLKKAKRSTRSTCPNQTGYCPPSILHVPQSLLEEKSTNTLKPIRTLHP